MIAQHGRGTPSKPTFCFADSRSNQRKPRLDASNGDLPVSDSGRWAPGCTRLPATDPLLPELLDAFSQLGEVHRARVIGYATALANNTFADREGG